MASIKIEVEKDEITKELDRLIKGPTAVTYGEFERVFVEVFGMIHELVHIQTGSLFSTGHIDTRMDDKYVWEGQIHYGGAAPGQINDPAYYGVYELARGGDHFFFAPAYELVPHDIVIAVLEFFASGEKG